MNLGMMRRRCVGKSLSTKDYVQDGLVAMWDGIENIGVGRHSDNASEWIDLTGNGRNMQLINDAYFNANSIVAEGNPIAEYTNTIPSNSHITQEIVFKITSDDRDNTNSRTIIAFFGITKAESGYNYSLSGLAYNRTVNSIGWMCKAFNVSKTNKEVITKTPICSTVIYDSNNLTRTPPVKFIINNTPLNIDGTDGWANTAQRNRIGNNFYGNIYAIRIYNRALTMAEISKNFELDKKRFGLNINTI